jgi:hypothetical protein
MRKSLGCIGSRRTSARADQFESARSLDLFVIARPFGKPASIYKRPEACFSGTCSRLPVLLPRRPCELKIRYSFDESAYSVVSPAAALSQASVAERPVGAPACNAEADDALGHRLIRIARNTNVSRVPSVDAPYPTHSTSDLWQRMGAANFCVLDVYQRNRAQRR